jgi:putative phage-type endonuclease
MFHTQKEILQTQKEILQTQKEILQTQKEMFQNMQNKIDNFTLPKEISDFEVLTDTEVEELLESATILIDELICGDPMLYIQPDFHELIVQQVEELIVPQSCMNNLFSSKEICVHNDTISYEINLIIENAMQLFYRHIAPCRSYADTFIRIKPNLSLQKSKIDYLKSIPQPDQRTDEWYLFRHKYLTASSIWKAFGTESSQNQLIYDKCRPINIDKYKSFSTESPMHWGHKYEPVSIRIYETMFKTQVSDFGCLPHKIIPFIAASPDGINTLETSDRYGRMLEVKNIVNREINGIPKMEYWIQMQVQMEVCNLNECDFWETRFTEYESFEEFMADQDSTEQKGVIMYFMKDGQPFYEYAPLNITVTEHTLWEESMMEKYANITWMKNIYWKLAEMSCVLVLRNKLWFKASLPILQQLWATIEHDKIHGYEHRAPSKKMRHIFPSEIRPNNECLIDFANL